MACTDPLGWTEASDLVLCWDLISDVSEPIKELSSLFCQLLTTFSFMSWVCACKREVV